MSSLFNLKLAENNIIINYFSKDGQLPSKQSDTQWRLLYAVGLLALGRDIQALRDKILYEEEIPVEMYETYIKVSNCIECFPTLNSYPEVKLQAFHYTIIEIEKKIIDLHVFVMHNHTGNFALTEPHPANTPNLEHDGEKS